MATANDVDIPQPVQSVMTGMPDLPGFKDASAPVSAMPSLPGFVDANLRPQGQGQPPQRPQVNMQEQGLGSTLASATGQAASAVGKVTSDLTQGVGEGALDTVHGTGELIRKTLNTAAQAAGGNRIGMGDLGNRVIPQQGQDALNQIATPDNTTQSIGKGIEKAAEFVAMSEMGGAAWSALSRSEQLGALAKTAKFLESHKVVLNAVNDAMAQGAQTFIQTGGDAKQAAEEAGTMGGLSAGMGLAAKPVSGLVNLLKKAGFAGDVLDRAAYVISKEPGSEEIRSGINDALDAKEDAMHADFDKAITGIKNSIGAKVVPLANTPLYEAAETIRNDRKLPEELQGALTSVVPHSKDVEPLLEYILNPAERGTAPANTAISGDALIGLRQQVNKAIKTADPAVTQDLKTILKGIDDTIDGLEGGTSKTYGAARTAYKNTLNDFDNPFVKAIRANNVTDLVDGLTKGTNAAAKVNSLRNLIGDTAMQELGMHRFGESISNALDKTTGSLNLNKFIKDWSNIPDEVKKGMFANNPADLRMLDGWIDQARKMSRTVSSVKWGARVTGLGLTALGTTGLLGEDRSKDAGLTGRDILSSAELLAGAAGLFGGKYASHSLQELLTDPALLNKLGAIGGYKPLGQTSGQAVKIAKTVGQAGRSAIATHIFNPETGGIEPTDQQ